MRKCISLTLLIALLLCACATQQQTGAQTDSTVPSGETESTPASEDGTMPTSPVQPTEGIMDWPEDATTATTTATQPTGGSNGTTPTESTTGSNGNDTTDETEPAAMLTWDAYMALTPAQRQEHDARVFGIGPDADDAAFEAFYAWRDAAFAEWEKNQNSQTGNGSVNIGDYTGGGN